ncbi:hypothetical protein HZB06_00150 [Candidatus Wolfebacteria bacterium]|nr:hypothetical protein [Candidatus Wolfebacteria bacterium]
MISGFYSKIPWRIKILTVFLLIILISYFVVRFLAIEPKNVPEEFLRARQGASTIADSIVFLSGESAKKIGEIAELDKERKYSDALNLISKELERNQQSREKAVELSKELEIMAKNLADISPSEAGQTALQAVSSETALISRLITYNDYLYQILGVLREKFLGKSDGDKIQELINKINGESQAIDDLNKKFNDTMKEFDGKF